MGEMELREQLRPKSSTLDLLGVERLYVFGSALTGMAAADSDIDFVADFREGALGLRSFFELEELLTSLFQRKIDLTTRDALPSPLRERVIARMAQVY